MTDIPSCDFCGAEVPDGTDHDLNDCADHLQDTVAELELENHRLESELTRAYAELEAETDRMQCELRGMMLAVWPRPGEPLQTLIPLSPDRAQILAQLAAGNLPVVRRIRMPDS